MRRMDRNGWSRDHSVQGIINQRLSDDPRCKPDERGWVQPFAVCQGWEEWNRAQYALRCVLLWRDAQRARIESDLRTFHFSLACSRRCDRPRLP